MKLLFLGAGATGGYFGGRLAAAGVDVTFLVRPPRASLLAREGLVIVGPGEHIVTPVKAITSAAAEPIYDAVVLSAKAYDLEPAIEAIRPAIGETTKILPLLNGLRHLDRLDAAFGWRRVLGGTCHISTTMEADGSIRRFSQFNALTQGARDPSQLASCEALHAILSRGGFEARLSGDVASAMWGKWVLLATLAAGTTLMRATIGEIVSADGGDTLISDLLDECCRIATACGHQPRQEVVATARAALTDRQSTISASMLRDMQGGRRTEADHIIGDLIRRGEVHGIASPLLGLAAVNLRVYEARLDAAPSAG